MVPDTWKIFKSSEGGSGDPARCGDLGAQHGLSEHQASPCAPTLPGLPVPCAGYRNGPLPWQEHGPVVCRAADVWVRKPHKEAQCSHRGHLWTLHRASLLLPGIAAKPRPRRGHQAPGTPVHLPSLPRVGHRGGEGTRVLLHSTGICAGRFQHSSAPGFTVSRQHCQPHLALSTQHGILAPAHWLTVGKLEDKGQLEGNPGPSPSL